MLDQNVITIILALIGLVGTFLGAKYGKQYGQVKTKFNEVVLLLNEVNNAAVDDKVTEEEFQAIMRAAKNVVDNQ